jgi:hypothetical protein
MAEIQVIFPSVGDAIVHSDPKAALWGECITWHILNQNKNIKKVKIEFDSRDAEFFPNVKNGGRHRYVKDLSGGSTIWGVAPDHKDEITDPSDPKRRRLEKYTVSGLDEDGKVISELDPQIVNSDPT